MQAEASAGFEACGRDARHVIEGSSEADSMWHKPMRGFRGHGGACARRSSFGLRVAQLLRPGTLTRTRSWRRCSAKEKNGEKEKVVAGAGDGR
eukprot:5973714-Pleurochrysis_carterae.AAC.1